MTQMGLHPVDPDQDPITCETCGEDVLERWYGSVAEHCKLTGLFLGYSYHCTSCLNVLARMADSLDALEGPDGPLTINDQGDVQI